LKQTIEETLAIGLAISDDSGWAERCGLLGVPRNISGQ